MALVLIKEDGTGKADANSYADAADADAYWEGNPWSTWGGLTPTQKDQALVFATRVIDAVYQFNGGKAMSTQGLQWPRTDCEDPDATVSASSILGVISRDRCVPSNVVPAGVVRATCEMAKELTTLDRTAAPPGEGIAMFSESSSQDEWADNPTTGGAGSGSSTSSSTTYNKSDKRPIISRLAQAMLSKYGTLVSGGSGAVRLVRA